MAKPGILPGLTGTGPPGTDEPGAKSGTGQRAGPLGERGRRMKGLWFTADLAREIQAGRKRDTIRPASSRLPCAGEIVRAQIGPRRAFALLRIESAEAVLFDGLDEDRRQGLVRLYPGRDLRSLVRLRFDVVEEK